MVKGICESKVAKIPNCAENCGINLNNFIPAFLNLLDTSGIPAFPDDVKIGWSKILDNPTISGPGEIMQFIDIDALRDYKNEQRANEHITSRLLFMLLCGHMGWEPLQVEIKKEEQGKPFVEFAGERRFVSFTHSKDLVMCAVSNRLDVGLDIESTKREVNPKIMNRILSGNEQKLHGDEELLKLWTMKEAAVKSIGTGLRTNLKDIELQKQDEGRFKIRVESGNEIELICFEKLEHYIALAY